MIVIDLRQLIIILLINYIAFATGYTRAQSDSWKEWLNGFFE